MQKRYFILILAITFCANLCFAQNGTTAYEFLNVSPSSHVYGLGGHNISIIDDDINLIEQNPALLGNEINKQVGLNYMRYLGSSNFMGVRYGMGINQRSAWAAGIQYFGYGSMPTADPDGIITGTTSPSDIVFSGSYSHDINDHWRGGITMKFAYSHYDVYSALAIAADLGVNYYNPDNDFSASMVIKNLGGQVKKFNETYDKLPWDIQIGFTKGILSTPLRLSITATNLRYWHLPYYEPAKEGTNEGEAFIKKDSFASNLFRHFTFALELLPNERIYIGLAYDHKTRTDMSTYSRNFLSGISLSAGLRVKGFGFGVAFAQPHTGATSFMVNINTSIGELMR